MKRLAGTNFTITLGDFAIPIDKATLGIEDNGKVSKSGGTPNGWMDGDVSASGDIELSPEAVGILTEVAKKEGSWEEMPAYDMLFYGKAVGSDGEEMKVEAFECKLRISDLLDVDRNGDAAPVTKLKFDVCGRDFVFINDVAYLSKERRERL